MPTGVHSVWAAVMQRKMFISFSLYVIGAPRGRAPRLHHGARKLMGARLLQASWASCSL